MNKLFAAFVITFLLYNPSFALEYEKMVFVEREKVAFVEIILRAVQLRVHLM